jgi:uncharacterized protein YhaN
MYIERIEVARFGSLADATVDGLGPGVQVLHGTNETGKTSLLEFVRAVFFGFEGLFRRGVLDPQVPCAGRLIVREGGDGQRISVERRHEGPHLATLTRASYEDDIIGLGGDDGDFLEIAHLDPAVDGRGRNRLYLQDLVGEIDEKTFTNVMAFGLDELHELRTLEPEGCGSRLYELASGLDRSKVARVLSHLREAMERLDSSDPAVSPIESLRQRRREALDRLAALQAPALAAGGLSAELTRIDAEIAALEGAIVRGERAEEVVRGVMPLEPLFLERRRTAERLAALQATPLVHADLDEWKRAARRRDRRAAVATKRKRVRSRLAREVAAIPAESAVWKKRAAIAGLCEEQPRLERMVADVARAESLARLAARRFGEHVGIAGLSRLVPLDRVLEGGNESLSELFLPEGFTRSFGPLRARARECAAAGHEVDEAKRAVAEAKGFLDDARGIIKGAGANLGGLTIAEAIEEASGRATLLRNRITAGEQLLELDRSAARLEREVAHHLEGQLIPVGWLIGLGAVFTIGAAMLLSGLLLPASVTGSLAYAIAALGLAGTGLASVATWSLDRAASGRLEAARRQLEMVQKQRSEAGTQCGLLDKRIQPDPALTLDRRAVLAQVEVERLEALAAREGSMHGLSDKLLVAEQSLERALERRKAARHGWRRALRQRGLPDTLSPRDVRQIGSHRHTLLTLDDDRRRLSEEARQKREDLATYGHRIEQMMAECDIVPEGTPIEHLHQLRDRLDAATLAHRRRGQLEKKLVRGRIRHRQARRQLRFAERRVREFLVRWGVENDKDFLAKVDRRPLFEQARREAAAADEAWAAARCQVTEPSDPEHWLLETDHVPLQRRLTEACEATDRLREAVIVAGDRRAAVLARVDAASRDHCTEPLQATIAEIEQQLAAHVDRRRLLERARTILEETRATVARDHQPPVLRDASHWLARLTEGRYTSITTTIDEARLEVHENDGRIWNPERLSRGTREQVFLALRLALVRDLQRHGIQLPIVMDDALVNFDDGRALAAARVLVEFVSDQPTERQMLVLTCHAHVAAIFARVGATVRALGAEPPPRAARRPDALPASRPAARRAVAVVSEPPVVPVPPRSGDDLHAAWPAEDFFFGQSSTPEAATTANDAGNGNADEPDDDRKIRQPARRTAARSRRRR